MTSANRPSPAKSSKPYWALILAAITCLLGLTLLAASWWVAKPVGATIINWPALVSQPTGVCALLLAIVVKDQKRKRLSLWLAGTGMALGLAAEVLWTI